MSKNFLIPLSNKIRRAYDILSDPRLKIKYDERSHLNHKYNDFVKKNKNDNDNKNDGSEYAFSQLIKGVYPESQKKRDSKKSEKDPSLNVSLFMLPFLSFFISNY